MFSDTNKYKTSHFPIFLLEFSYRWYNQNGENNPSRACPHKCAPSPIYKCLLTIPNTAILIYIHWKSDITCTSEFHESRKGLCSDQQHWLPVKCSTSSATETEIYSLLIYQWYFCMPPPSLSMVSNVQNVLYPSCIKWFKYWYSVISIYSLHFQFALTTEACRLAMHMPRPECSLRNGVLRWLVQKHHSFQNCT